MKTIYQWGKIILPLTAILLLIFLINEVNGIKSIAILKATLFPFIFSFLIAWVLNPIVVLLQNKFKLKRWISTLIIIIIIALIITIITLLFVPQVISEIKILVSYLPSIERTFDKLLRHAQNFFGVDISKNLIQKINSQISSIGKSVFSGSVVILYSSISFIGGLTAFIFILLMVIMATIYILIDFDNITLGIKKIIPDRMKNDAEFLTSETNRVIVGYIRGLIIESIIAGLLAYIAFLIAGLEGALVFGTIIGITNIIPYIGPFIGAIPACIFALTQSFQLFIVVLIIICVLRIIGDFIVKPKVYGKTTEVHPALSIMAVLIFGELFGIIGIIFAIPIMGLFIIIIKFVYNKLIIKYPKVFK